MPIRLVFRVFLQKASGRVAGSSELIHCRFRPSVRRGRKMAMHMNEYITLGRSGLLVSPLGLGTMTFGNDSWGSKDNESRAIFDRYVETGGNFIDTADIQARRRRNFSNRAGALPEAIVPSQPGHAQTPGKLRAARRLTDLVRREKQKQCIAVAIG
jgi:hypothetical protein